MSDDTRDGHLPDDEELRAIQRRAREAAAALFTAIVKRHRPLGHCPECCLVNAVQGVLASVGVVLDAIYLDNEQRRVEWVDVLREALDDARANRDPRLALRAVANRMPAVPGVH